MMKWFSRDKQPEGQVVEPDVIPPHIMPNHDDVVALGYGAKQYIKGFLKGLSRTQLMDFADGKQFDGTKAEDAALEACNDVEWGRLWPLGEYGYKERIPTIIIDTIPVHYKRSENKQGVRIKLDLNKLEDQVKGIQKKLDKVETLISTAEFTLSGKAALKL